MLDDRAGAPCGAFAHRRLAIIDLSPSGHQPMTSADGQWAITFNGEIFNYAALRDWLAGEGVTFRGSSDTEVLLEGWARFGRAMLPRLRGMFAFVLWDRVHAKAYFVRDRFGIKPLYVAMHDGGLAFASEVRAILASGLVAPELSPDAVASYLANGSVQEPLTLVHGIRSLPAGSVTEATVGKGRVTLSHSDIYATPLEPRDGEPVKDGRQAAVLVRAALKDSVEHHLVADVPVAMFLSGGIDSSALVALAAEGGRQLETFTVVFDEEEFSELAPARAVAQRFGTRHHVIPLSGEDLLRALPEALRAMDQPSMDGLNTYVVSRAVRERDIKVVLSGLGGDELFAGYPSFTRARRLARMGAALGPLRRPAATIAARVGGRRAAKLAMMLRDRSVARGAYTASRALFASDELRALAGRRAPEAVEPPPAGLSMLQQVSWYELTGYMRSTLLRDSDVFSMAHALELRVPFLDPAVAAASVGIDDSLKLARGRSKPILVESVRDLLPREVWDRPKRGFALPFERWMRGPLRDTVASVFAGEGLSRLGIDAGEARAVWTGFLDGKRYNWSRPWAIFTLARWAEQHDVSLDSEAAGASPVPVLAAR
jgi:asparagine synthase (glutamine-hydrolysing)